MNSRPIVAATSARSAGGRRQTVEACGDQGVDGGRQRDRRGCLGAEPRPDRLDDEQRVALGLRPQPCRRLLRSQGPSADGAAISAVAPRSRGPRAITVGTRWRCHRSSSCAPASLLVADRAGDEDRSRRSALDEDFAELHRVRVAPLEVIDDEQQRFPHGQETAAHRREEMMAPSEVGRRRGVREARMRQPGARAAAERARSGRRRPGCRDRGAPAQTAASRSPSPMAGGQPPRKRGCTPPRGRRRPPAGPAPPRGGTSRSRPHQRRTARGRGPRRPPRPIGRPPLSRPAD